MEPKYIFVKQRDMKVTSGVQLSNHQLTQILEKHINISIASYRKNNWSATLAFEKNSAIEVAHDFSISLDILQYEYRFNQLRDFLQLMKLVQVITSFLAKPQC